MIDIHLNTVLGRLQRPAHYVDRDSTRLSNGEGYLYSHIIMESAVLKLGCFIFMGYFIKNLTISSDQCNRFAVFCRRSVLIIHGLKLSSGTHREFVADSISFSTCERELII